MYTRDVKAGDEQFTVATVVPVLGVGAAIRMNKDLIEDARIALGAVASRPFLVEKAGQFLEGKKLGDEIIEEASRLVASRAKSMDTPTWISTGGRTSARSSRATHYASCAVTT